MRLLLVVLSVLVLCSAKTIDEMQQRLHEWDDNSVVRQEYGARVTQLQTALALLQEDAEKLSQEFMRLEAEMKLRAEEEEAAVVISGKVTSTATMGTGASASSTGTSTASANDSSNNAWGNDDVEEVIVKEKKVEGPCRCATFRPSRCSIQKQGMKEFYSELLQKIDQNRIAEAVWDITRKMDNLD